MNWENHLIKDLQWSNEIINREAKERVAREIAATAKTGDVIGAGSGSTVYLTLFELAKRIHEEHLYLEVIPASQEISMTCIQLGIPQTTLWDKRPDWTFDGADEVDPDRNLIKGRGGAMFKEAADQKQRKNLHYRRSQQTCQYLGKQIPIPVEVFPHALSYVEKELRRLGASEISLRPAHGKDGPILTENGNFILDTRFHYIDASLEEQLKTITGVIESGLFINYDIEVVVTR